MVTRIERLKITSTEEWLAWRERDVTASVAAALFGAHQFETIYGLHARVTGSMPQKPDSTAMLRGREMQSVVGKQVAREHPNWRIRECRHYYRDPVARLGATPDFFIRTAEGKRGVLQAKTTNPQAFRRSWSDTTVPGWILIQTLVEMMLTRSSFGVIAALEVGDYKFQLHEYEVPRHAGAEKRIRDAVAAFWLSVNAGEIPKPDYTRDGALIAALNANAVPDKEIDLRTDNRMPELLKELDGLKLLQSDLEEKRRSVESEIKAKIGDAEIALVNGWRVTLKQINKKAYLVKETSYRQLRVVHDDVAPDTSDIPEAGEEWFKKAKRKGGEAAQ